jgi:hypothetical protein
MWVVQTQSINGEELSTIEILISKLAFNIQIPLPDSGIAGIARVKPFRPFSFFFLHLAVYFDLALSAAP